MLSAIAQPQPVLSATLSLGQHPTLKLYQSILQMNTNFLKFWSFWRAQNQQPQHHMWHLILGPSSGQQRLRQNLIGFNKNLYIHYILTETLDNCPQMHSVGSAEKKDILFIFFKNFLAQARTLRKCTNQFTLNEGMQLHCSTKSLELLHSHIFSHKFPVLYTHWHISSVA